MKSSSVAFREIELGKGRDYCRFNFMETGVKFGAHYKSKNACISVYLGVTAKAPRKQRMLFKEVIEKHVSEVETEMGMKLHWGAPFCWCDLPANITDRSDWPRQHQWVKEIAEKFATVFQPRLGIE